MTWYKRAALLAASIGVVVIIYSIPGIRHIELTSLEWFKTSTVMHPDIAIVAIDNKSLQTIGRWPWDRSIHAALIHKLNSFQPRAVGIDISFSEPQNEANDAALAQSLSESTVPYVLAAQAVFENNASTPAYFKLPLPQFTQLSHVAVGHVNAPVSFDGVARVMPEALSWGQGSVLPFSQQVAKSSGAEGLTVSEQGRGVIARIFSPQKLISFAGNAGTIPTFSASDVIAGTVSGEEFKDKIILVGATASDLHDMVFIPNGANMAGVEWNASVLSNILLHNTKSLLPVIYSIILGLLLGGVSVLLYMFAKPRYSNYFFIVMLILLPAVSALLWRAGIAFGYMGNVIALAILYFGQAILRWVRAEGEKKKLKENLQFYFSPQVLQLVLENPSQLTLGGERKEVTVFFSDIRSFTTITETVDPSVLSSLLYEYFTEMSEEIFTTDGVLDKFIGDAIMAFWGAPIAQEDQADRAVSASLRMMKRLKKLQVKWQSEGLLFLDIGIGIHTGIATVGNMGSSKRFDYTVIGDCVNAASRLEGLNKQYGTHIIISEETKNKLTIPVTTKFLGDVQVKGKNKAIRIYEVLESE